MRHLLVLLLLVSPAQAAVQLADITYSSSIDSINNLAARIAYEDTASDLPVVLLMHGFSGDKDSFGDPSLTRMADYGLFIVSVSMRGRSGAGGSQDASGREIYDIYDALVYVRANYAAFVSPTRVAVVGYSGGGANALAFASRFPDTAQDIVSHFGISDYGYDPTDGWYNQSESDPYKVTLASWIGGTPGAVPDAYRSRDYTQGIANYSGGLVYLFHDVDDVVVPLVHSQNISAALTAASLSNYAEDYSNSGSTFRWVHGYPTPGGDLLHTEDTWAPAVTGETHSEWIVPAIGTVRVLGWIKTKRFEVWLGDGTDEVADLSYNVFSGAYTVTPLTGSVDVVVTQGGVTTSATISSETTITVKTTPPALKTAAGADLHLKRFTGGSWQ